MIALVCEQTSRAGAWILLPAAALLLVSALLTYIILTRRF